LSATVGPPAAASTAATARPALRRATSQVAGTATVSASPTAVVCTERTQFRGVRAVVDGRKRRLVGGRGTLERHVAVVESAEQCPETGGRLRVWRRVVVETVGVGTDHSQTLR
jgi:hypothetical protein